MRFTAVGLLAGVLFCTRIAWAAPDQESSEPQVSKERQKMTETAEKAYEASMAMWGVGAGGVTLEAVYTWSRRWAEAEADGVGPEARRKAYAAHLLRMRKIREMVGIKHDQAVAGGEEDKFQAARYYLAEAEYWLAKIDSAAASSQKQSRDKKAGP